ncbi:MAG: DUF6252 family protein [Cyclobacteriaceae bacterium]
MKYVIFIIISLTVGLTGCEKESGPTLGVVQNDNRRPDGLSDSEEIARLVVNGQPWIYNDEMEVRAENLEGYFLTVYINTDVPDLNLALVINDAQIEEKTYKLGPSTAEGSASATLYYNSPEVPCSYHFRHVVDGELTLTEYNTETAVCRGTFEFTAYTPYCDTVTVSRGRFASTLHF